MMTPSRVSKERILFARIAESPMNTPSIKTHIVSPTPLRFNFLSIIIYPELVCANVVC